MFPVEEVEMDKLGVILADDHQMLREGLRLLINSQVDMEVVGEAENGEVAVVLAQKLQPDVVVMDISMPEMNGLKATQCLIRSCPKIKVLILTRHTDDGYLQQLLQSGSSGYVLKQSASDELVRAIRVIACGQIYLDPAVASEVVGNIFKAHKVRGSSLGKNLSAREEEVLRLVAWGFLSKEIAARLQISIKTVDAHKTNAMVKLGMKSRIDIVRYALLQGWLQDN
jgi:two-component system, NarL family, response regulator NreC